MIYDVWVTEIYDVLEQGEDAVLAYMKDNGYDMPEVY